MGGGAVDADALAVVDYDACRLALGVGNGGGAVGLALGADVPGAVRLADGRGLGGWIQRLPCRAVEADTAALGRRWRALDDTAGAHNSSALWKWSSDGADQLRSDWRMPDDLWFEFEQQEGGRGIKDQLFNFLGWKKVEELVLYSSPTFLLQIQPRIVRDPHVNR